MYTYSDIFLCLFFFIISLFSKKKKKKKKNCCYLQIPKQKKVNILHTRVVVFFLIGWTQQMRVLLLTCLILIFFVFWSLSTRGLECCKWKLIVWSAVWQMVEKSDRKFASSDLKSEEKTSCVHRQLDFYLPRSSIWAVISKAGMTFCIMLTMWHFSLITENVLFFVFFPPSQQ